MYLVIFLTSKLSICTKMESSSLNPLVTLSSLVKLNKKLKAIRTI